MATVRATEDTGIVPIPKTITPGRVWGWNFVIFVAIYFIFHFPFGWGWALVPTLLILGATIASGENAVEGKDYHGFLLFDPLTKTRRVIFPGLHAKSFWESIEKGSEESLRQVVTSEGPENFPTNDPAENMVANLTVHKRMNVSGTPEQAAENFVRFHSTAKDSLTKVVRKEIVKRFSGYYGGQEMENLTKGDAVQEAVSENTDVKAKIAEMEARWGIFIGVILNTSNPDDETKKLKRTPARAEALRTAIKKLMEEGGLDREQARRAALSLDETAEFSEGHTTFDLNVVAPDLKNMTHLSVLGGLGGGDKGHGKGGKK